MHPSCDWCSAKLEDEMTFNIIFFLSWNGYSELTVLQQTFYQIWGSCFSHMLYTVIHNDFHRFCLGMQWEAWYRYFLICIIYLFVSELTNCVGYTAYDGMTLWRFGKRPISKAVLVHLPQKTEKNHDKHHTSRLIIKWGTSWI
jgi:hypothetical protein